MAIKCQVWSVRWRCKGGVTVLWLAEAMALSSLERRASRRRRSRSARVRCWEESHSGSVLLLQRGKTQTRIRETRIEKVPKKIGQRNLDSPELSFIYLAPNHNKNHHKWLCIGRQRVNNNGEEHPNIHVMAYEQTLDDGKEKTFLTGRKEGGRRTLAEPSSGRAIYYSRLDWGDREKQWEVG